MLERTDHRPWPAPRAPWAMFMRWQDLAFLHWPVEPAGLRSHVPSGLELETRDGHAWLGITPFRMSHVRARFTPALPRVSAFPELNVRTYVSAGGKPGVWFLSLDAANSLAVRTARWVFGLPYFCASMSVESDGDRIGYRSVRTGDEGVRLRASYAPEGPVRTAESDTLEHWLTERYCLYSVKNGTLYRGEIHHDPWPLQEAEVVVGENTMAEPAGLTLDGPPPLVHFARQLDVVAWLPRAVGG